MSFTCSSKPPALSQRHINLHVWSYRDPIIYSKFYRNPFRGFEAPVGQNLAFPITLASRFYNSLYYRISRDKAPGPDGLPTWLLKECTAYLSEPLAALYNTSLKEGIFPEVWKSAEIIPVLTITPVRSIQLDRRPIALLPVVAKVFEGFVRECLLDSLSPTFDALQFDCLKGRSTAHALTSMLHTWQSSLDNGHSVRLLLVDFSKAFDRVNHNILFQKLLDRNVPQCLLRWFFSYLSLRQQRTCVKVKHQAGSISMVPCLRVLCWGYWPFWFKIQIDDLAPGCLAHKLLGVVLCA